MKIQTYRVLRGYVVPFDSYSLPTNRITSALDGVQRVKKTRKRKPKRTLPAEIVATVKRENRAPLKQAIKRIGGYNTERACESIRSENKRKTWKSTKAYARELSDETGTDFGALDAGSACLTDEFCKPLELTGKRCPDSAAKGGWSKAVRIGLGSKDRRFDKIESRPQFRVLQEALECQGVKLAPQAVTNARNHSEAVIACQEGHSREVQELIEDAKKGRLKRPNRKDVPF